MNKWWYYAQGVEKGLYRTVLAALLADKRRRMLQRIAARERRVSWGSYEQ